MKEEIICAGFGGQGVMLLGKIMAYSALSEGKHVTWIPSYGAAMRGGTAFCMVVIADEEIASPYVENSNTLFVFNQPSWDKFQHQVKANGLALLNSTLIHNNKEDIIEENITLRSAPFTEIASGLGNAQAANMAALGVFLRERDVLKYETVLKVLSELAPRGRQDLVDINKKALEKGYNYFSRVQACLHRDKR